jgi:hypothetical protein
MKRPLGRLLCWLFRSHQPDYSSIDYTNPAAQTITCERCAGVAYVLEPATLHPGLRVLRGGRQ